MDQNFYGLIQQRRAEICHRWQTATRETGLVADDLLEKFSQDPFSFYDTILNGLLAALISDEPPDPQLVDTLAQELTPGEFSAQINSLRRTLFETVVEHIAPGRVGECWPALAQGIDRISIAVTGAMDCRLNVLGAERVHWRNLYNLTHELSTSIDLNYVLQNAIARILEITNAERGAVFLIDAPLDRLTPHAVQDWQDIDLAWSDLPSDWRRGYGSPRILNADNDDHNGLGRLVSHRTETVVAAPLLTNGQLYGVLAIATLDDIDSNSKQMDLIHAVAGNLAFNLGNSEVIQTLNDQARELGVMLRQHQEESSKREAILASITDGVVFNDQRGKIVLVNRAAELILAIQAQNLIGRDINRLFELFTSGARQQLVRAITSAMSNPQAEIVSDSLQTILHIDNLIIDAQWAPVVTAHGEFLGIVTVFRDITKEIEADRTKSDFVSTVSHELRTPMTAIKGYTDLLYGEMVGEINDNQKRFLSIIRNNADRLTALISDLLDISRVETGRVRFEPEIIQVGDIAKSVVDALSPNAINKGHTLSYRIEGGLPEIMGDPGRLNQVFTNLVGNAINYTPAGGMISVDILRVEGAVRIDVRDNGIGIQAEDLAKIFERFYRADHPLVQESRGTGLGLPIVKMFVEMHGGRVWAESEVGQGSSFTVLLPTPTTQLEEGPESVPTRILHRSVKRHALVADDDPDIAELVKLQLVEAGFGVTLVGRGVKVLEIARRQRPDLIVLDILLPDMDGRAVLEALKTEPATAGIPVLMLTVLADDGSTTALGAAEYLTKPIDAGKLMDAVEAALSRRGRILVVEDDVDTFEMMRVALRRVGYDVDVAADGYEALSLARRWQPQAILLDLRLPGMDGYETLTHLKRSLDTTSIPIIVTSAHVANPDEETKQLQSMGVVSFLPKPYTVNQLIAEIDQAIRGNKN